MISTNGIQITCLVNTRFYSLFSCYAKKQEKFHSNPFSYVEVAKIKAKRKNDVRYPNVFSSFFCIPKPYKRLTRCVARVCLDDLFPSLGLSSVKLDSDKSDKETRKTVQ